MGIRSGGLTFTRYLVRGKPPKDLRQRYTRGARAHVLTPLQPEDEATEAVGWCALGRPFDLELDPTKLFEGAALLVGLRVDRWRVPTALLRAQLEDEEQAVLARTGKKRLSRVERVDIKQKLTRRLRRKTAPSTRAFDVYWDLDGGTVLFFSHAPRIKEAFAALFEKSFGLELDEDSPFLAAERAALPQAMKRRLSKVEPTALVTPRRRGRLRDEASGATPETGDPEETTAPDDERDRVDRIETTRFLGSELLLWLWLRTELVGGELALPSWGKVEVWLDQHLVLCSPIDSKESVVVRGVAPADGAEAREAVRAQKLPMSGHVVVRTHQGDFSFVLKGPLFAVASGGVPPLVTDEGGDAFADRLDRVQQLIALLDLLFTEFLRDRLSPTWHEGWEPAIAGWLAQRPASASILAKLRGGGAEKRGARRG